MLSHSLKFALALAVVAAAGSLAPAQDWAKKMFKTTTHEFGTVARGAKSEVTFELTNLYKEELHIASVRSSCGCTTPTITRDTVPSLQTSEIIATFNTKSYTGHRNSTLTVVFDKPFYAEVQLNVSGFIRGDVVFQPASVNFGSIDAGMPASQDVSVSYAGRNGWKIVDVTSARDYYQVQLAEKARAGGKVEYVMTVSLKETAPVGFLNDQLIIVTNDESNPNIPLVVEGQVKSPLTVSPASLALGELAPGDTVTRKVIVISKKPCILTGVKCDDCFKVELPEGANTKHIVPITFTADKAGRIATKIELQTDLGGAAVTATGEIK